MGKKHTWLFITTITLGTAIAIFSYKKYIDYNKQKTLNEKISKAEKYLKLKRFNDAISIYNEIKKEINISSIYYLKLLIIISGIYLELKEYKESLNICEEILKKEKNNILALKRSFKCNKELENIEKAMDLFYKISKFDSEFIHKEKIFLKEFTKKKVNKKMNTKFIPKHIYWNEMILMFPNLKKRLEIIDLKKIYEIDILKMEEKNQKFYIFVYAMIENIKENYSNARELLEGQNFLYSVLLREQIDSLDSKYIPSKAFENILISSQDPSVILYASIIFNKTGDSREKEFIEKGLKTTISYFFIVLKIQNYFNSLSLELAEKKVYKLIIENKTNDHILIPLKTCITYFLSENLIEFAKKYIDILEKICPKSIFVLIYKGMFAEKINDNNAKDIYNMALIKMPDMYETNLRMGSYLMNKSDESFINYIKNAYDNSSTFREAYYAYNILLSYEMFKNMNLQK